MTAPLRVFAEEIVSLVDGKFGGSIELADGSLEANRLCGEVAKESLRRFGDVSLDPFSDEYFCGQVNLYKELAGRELNQESGEILPVDLTPIEAHANPYGTIDVAFVSKYQFLVSSVLRAYASSMLSRAYPLSILDLGCGRGLTCEIMAITGSKVVGVDIDPKMASFSSQRASARGFEIQRICSSYDNLDLLDICHEGFDIALFCASLHHSTKPWELLGSLKTKIHEEGVIAFIEEPVNSFWWSHWGLRLDLESIYVTAKYGWFESGFSHDFLDACAQRVGLKYSSSVNALGDRIGFFSVSHGVMARMEEMLGSVGYSHVPLLSRAVEPLSDYSGSLRASHALNAAKPSSAFDVVVEVHNSGFCDWPLGGANPIRASYHWYHEVSGEVMYNGFRSDLPGSLIRAGQVIKAVARIETPSWIGPSRLLITLVHEGIAWFEDVGFEPYVLEHIYIAPPEQGQADAAEMDLRGILS